MTDNKNNKPKHLIGISTLALQEKYGDKKAIELASRVGADAIDFLLGEAPDNKDSLYSKPDNVIIDYYSNLKAYADSLGISICQTHGRASAYNKQTIEKCRLDCLATAALGAKAMVIHGIVYDYVPENASPQFIRDLNYKLFMEILPFAKKSNIKIAAETLANSGSRIDFFGNTNEFFDFCNRISQSEYKDWFTVCMDTGHSHKAVRYGFENVADVIRRLGKYITVLHLNDNNGIKDQHKMPFSGSINWNDVFDALDEIGFDGVYNMELSLGYYGSELMIDHAEFAIKVLRNYLNKRLSK